MRKVLLLIGFLSLSFGFASAQGSIAGVVKDAKTGEAIIGSNVVIKGTQIGGSTDLEGKFLINNVAAGTYTIQVTFVTYTTQEIANVVVEDGKLATVDDVQLSESSQQLDEVVVKGIADKTSESVLLSDRKKSIEMVQSIGAQE
jgi:hypothetical protein